MAPEDIAAVAYFTSTFPQHANINDAVVMPYRSSQCNYLQ
jgi:NADP-dependent 3-hydroxy acid dehydrogenase YdfG